MQVWLRDMVNIAVYRCYYSMQLSFWLFYQVLRFPSDTRFRSFLLFVYIYPLRPFEPLHAAKEC